MIAFVRHEELRPYNLNQWKTNFSQPIKIWITCTTTPDSLQGYHINNFKGTYRDFNLHNQLHIHKICSSDINKSPACFGTSQVPLSDPSQHPQNGPLQGRWAKNTAKHFHTYNVCSCVCTSVSLRVLWRILRGLPDDGTCDVTDHAGDLLPSDEHMLWM